jgi:hypothetical protein
MSGIRQLFSLSYPLRRKIEIPYLAFFVLIIAALLLSISTIGGIVTSGYQYVATLSNDFNKTVPEWYDRFGGELWAPVSWSCQASVMKPGEGTTSPVSARLDVSHFEKHYRRFLAATRRISGSSTRSI